MTQSDKQAIAKCLTAYIGKYESQSAAANSLTGISGATVSQVINNNWQLISDSMWRKIGKQCCLRDFEWQVAQTSVFVKITEFFKDAQLNPNGIRSLGIEASKGKTVAVKHYCDKNLTAYYVQCYQKMRARDVLRETLKSMGKVATGTYHDMLNSLIHYMETTGDPLLIIDEIDKLGDKELQMFIDLENRLHGKCGIVFISTMWFKAKMERSVNAGRQGFAELWSRMRKDVHDLTPTSHEFRRDIQLIANANGIADNSVIINITNGCKDDLRVVYDKINAYNKTKSA